MTTNSPRIYAYDFLKSVAVFLICFYHFGTLDCNYQGLLSHDYFEGFKYFLSSIACISVPLFLMVNGALLLNRDYSLKRHLVKLVYIYILFFVWAVITLLAEAPVYKDHYNLYTFVAAVFSAKQGRLDHLWFLQLLGYLYMMFPIIKAVYDSSKTSLTVYLLGLIFVFTFGITCLQDIINVIYYVLAGHHPGFNIVESITWLSPFGSYFPHALVYFIAGGWIARHINRIKITPAIAAIALLFSWVVLFVFALWKTYTSLKLYDTGFEAYNKMMPLIMTISTFILCLKLNINSWKLKNVIYRVSSNSLGIYFIHVPVGVWLTGYYVQFPISNYLFYDILYVMLLMVLSLGVTLLLKKIPLIRNLVDVNIKRSSSFVAHRRTPIVLFVKRVKSRVEENT